MVFQYIFQDLVESNIASPEIESLHSSTWRTQKDDNSETAFSTIASYANQKIPFCFHERQYHAKIEICHWKCGILRWLRLWRGIWRRRRKRKRENDPSNALFWQIRQCGPECWTEKRFCHWNVSATAAAGAAAAASAAAAAQQSATAESGLLQAKKEEAEKCLVINSCCCCYGCCYC